MKLFLLSFTLITNLANAGTMTSGHFHWPTDNTIEASAYGMDKSVAMAELDARGAIFSGFKVAKDKAVVSYCLEVLEDGSCRPNSPVIVVLPLVKN
ncbi:hypothetical protein SHI21_07935 [Bacteriovorax sp. PP10]|uniref:Uncharacterized protein n=1 Tax=Bacteriovorax antarcticus TaxID=3088717 RepID=A0ABU5VSU7_9BACT|nr:hypothetical protein [Bacteriovorax sp. PP10]MEA9356126.1 hypothetical protein [Bacteriovorax sp. PP10]